jgi:hypothetical protein
MVAIKSIDVGRNVNGDRRTRKKNILIPDLANEAERKTKRMKRDMRPAGVINVWANV